MGFDCHGKLGNEWERFVGEVEAAWVRWGMLMIPRCVPYCEQRQRRLWLFLHSKRSYNPLGNHWHPYDTSYLERKRYGIANKLFSFIVKGFKINARINTQFIIFLLVKKLIDRGL